MSRYTQEELDVEVAHAEERGWSKGRDAAYGQKMLAPERTEFMRRAVIALYAGGVRDAAECWATARALWDAEPREA
jgi:hypothetical protein